MARQVRLRLLVYIIGLIVFGAILALQFFNVIDSGTAAALGGKVDLILSLFGVGGFGTAAYNLNKQARNGAFDPVTPADKVLTGLQEAMANAQNAQGEVERIKDALSTAVKDVPVLGPLAQQALDSLPKT